MNLQDQIAATAELCGAQLSKVALAMLAMDLDAYPPDAVCAALKRCRMEHKGRLTAEAVISRIEDGRPGPEEAWAMIPRDEQTSVVWTDEVAESWGIASPLIEEGDRVAARMAFIEHYRKVVSKARMDGKVPTWTPSLGFNNTDRLRALNEAADKGRIPHDHPQLLACKEIKEGVEDKSQAPLGLVKIGELAESIRKKKVPDWIRSAI